MCPAPPSEEISSKVDHCTWVVKSKGSSDQPNTMLCSTKVASASENVLDVLHPSWETDSFMLLVQILAEMLKKSMSTHSITPNTQSTSRFFQHTLKTIKLPSQNNFMYFPKKQTNIKFQQIFCCTFLHTGLVLIRKLKPVGLWLNTLLEDVQLVLWFWTAHLLLFSSSCSWQFWKPAVN